MFTVLIIAVLVVAAAVGVFIFAKNSPQTTDKIDNAAKSVKNIFKK